MNDTTYQIFQDGQTYKVRITQSRRAFSEPRPGNKTVHRENRFTTGAVQKIKWSDGHRPGGEVL
jgi:hypothetical protein